MQPNLRFAILLVLLFLLLSPAACSRISLGYNNAEFFIERYADSYLSLDSAQMAAWQPAVKDALARHRREELPYLAAFFDAAYSNTKSHFDAPAVECLLDAFEEIYRRHFRIIAALAAPLLAELTPGQIQGLERKFREEDADEAKEDKDSVRHREHKRAKRYAKSAELWIGPLTKPQRAIIADVTAAMPDTARAWETYRGAKRAALIRLLQEHRGEAEIRRFLTDWLVEYRDLPPQLQQVRLEMGRGIVDLFVHMDASFSPEQRAHFAGRLRDLRDDFMDLQPHPRIATTACPGAGAAMPSETSK
jgi:hypothetical protein